MLVCPGQRCSDTGWWRWCSAMGTTAGGEQTQVCHNGWYRWGGYAFLQVIS